MYPGKRLFDIVGAASAFVILSPVFLACALLVRLGSSGPVIYAGERVGLGERRFRQLKFRTMVVGADRSGFQTTDDDSRVTTVGRWLRVTSLDEMPQLFNVISGDMSLVGPRPAAVPQLDLYTEGQRLERARVRPGITGLAQAGGRSALSLAEAIALDIEYARQASLWLDLQVIARTLAVVVRRSGSN